MVSKLTFKPESFRVYMAPQPGFEPFQIGCIINIIYTVLPKIFNGDEFSVLKSLLNSANRDHDVAAPMSWKSPCQSGHM